MSPKVSSYFTLIAGTGFGHNSSSSMQNVIFSHYNIKSFFQEYILIVYHWPRYPSMPMRVDFLDHNNQQNKAGLQYQIQPLDALPCLEKHWSTPALRTAAQWSPGFWTPTYPKLLAYSKDRPFMFFPGNPFNTVVTSKWLVILKLDLSNML